MDLERKTARKIGAVVQDWVAPDVPSSNLLLGHYCRLEALDLEKHGADLFEAYQLDTEGRSWTYLPYEPFDNLGAYLDWIRQSALGVDPLFYAILDSASEHAVGVASYLNIVPEHGRIEVGHINYSPQLQRTTAATEAMYLMMKYALELGYRRYEWKCDALNKSSRLAAGRLGFKFEGVHRQHVIVKGRNRDTAWYSVLGTEWPGLKEVFQRWLEPSNFDGDGQQITRLSALTTAP